MEAGDTDALKEDNRGKNVSITLTIQTNTTE